MENNIGVHVLKYSNSDNVLDFLNKYSSIISPERYYSFKGGYNQAKRLQVLLADLFIKKCIADCKEISPDSITFWRNQYGKPYLKMDNSLFFSLSHTEGCVCVALSNKNIGIDVEKVDKEHFEIAKSWFSKEEYSFYELGNNRAENFCTIWTAKEAYVKKIGTGFLTPFTSFDVISPSFQNEFFHRISFHSEEMRYVCTVCSEDNSNIIVHHESVNELEAFYLKSSKK